MRFLTLLDGGTPAGWIVGAIVLMIAVGAADRQTGPNVTFELFYTLPVAMAAWCCGPYVGWAFALACAVMWIIVDFTKGRFEVALWAYTWNFGSRLALLMAFSAILTALRHALQREKELARRDFVTHTFNLRAFHELAQLEIVRSRRHQRPLTVIYLDVDHFKTINDQLGHAEGDRFLHAVSTIMTANVRANDFVGRVGGDEFVILLPETGPDAARAVVGKLRSKLMEAIRANSWPVTFSIGVLSCIPSAESSADLIRRADELMYQVKSDTKDGVTFSDRIGEMASS